MIVYGNYYFESVVSTDTLKKIELWFIGVAKTTTNNLPMKYFTDI